MARRATTKPFDLASVLKRLRPLLGEPMKNAAAIAALLEKHEAYAEIELARMVVSKAMAPHLGELMADPSARRRIEAVSIVRQTMGRREAGTILRKATKDPDPMVRRAAVRATRKLLLFDVALPARRPEPVTIPARRGKSPFTGEAFELPAQVVTPRGGIPDVPLGGWNPTGWSFGLRQPSSPRVRRWSHPRIAPLADLAGRAGLAAALGCTASDLTRLTRAGDGPGSPYVRFTIPKATGGERTITAPRAALKRIQRRILADLLAHAPVHEACHGFVRGRSTLTHASAHRGAKLCVRIDLEDFFPTVHFHRVVGLFESLGANAEVAWALAALTTHRPVNEDGEVTWPSVLPQGAPTSPAIANLVCRRLDARLAGLAGRVGATYTRYADDLTFSFVSEPERGLGRFFWWVNEVLLQEGFHENVKKRRVMRPSGRRTITGLILSDDGALRAPRELRRRLRAIVHRCAREGVTREATGHDQPRAYLLGLASYVAMVDPLRGKAMLERARELARGR